MVDGCHNGAHFEESRNNLYWNTSVGLPCVWYGSDNPDGDDFAPNSILKSVIVFGAEAEDTALLKPKTRRSNLVPLDEDVLLKFRDDELPSNTCKLSSRMFHFLFALLDYVEWDNPAVSSYQFPTFLFQYLSDPTALRSWLDVIDRQHALPIGSSSVPNVSCNLIGAVACSDGVNSAANVVTKGQGFGKILLSQRQLYLLFLCAEQSGCEKEYALCTSQGDAGGDLSLLADLSVDQLVAFTSVGVASESLLLLMTQILTCHAASASSTADVKGSQVHSPATKVLAHTATPSASLSQHLPYLPRHPWLNLCPFLKLPLQIDGPNFQRTQSRIGSEFQIELPPLAVNTSEVDNGDVPRDNDANAKVDMDTCPHGEEICLSQSGYESLWLKGKFITLPPDSSAGSETFQKSSHSSCHLIVGQTTTYGDVTGVDDTTVSDSDSDKRSRAADEGLLELVLTNGLGTLKKHTVPRIPTPADYMSVNAPAVWSTWSQVHYELLQMFGPRFANDPEELHRYLLKQTKRLSVCYRAYEALQCDSGTRRTLTAMWNTKDASMLTALLEKIHEYMMFLLDGDMSRSVVEAAAASVTKDLPEDSFSDPWIFTHTRQELLDVYFRAFPRFELEWEATEGRSGVSTSSYCTSILNRASPSRNHSLQQSESEWSCPLYHVMAPHDVYAGPASLTVGSKSPLEAITCSSALGAEGGIDIAVAAPASIETTSVGSSTSDSLLSSETEAASIYPVNSPLHSVEKYSAEVPHIEYSMTRMEVMTELLYLCEQYLVRSRQPLRTPARGKVTAVNSVVTLPSKYVPLQRKLELGYVFPSYKWPISGSYNVDATVTPRVPFNIYWLKNSQCPCLCVGIVDDRDKDRVDKTQRLSSHTAVQYTPGHAAPATPPTTTPHTHTQQSGMLNITLRVIPIRCDSYHHEVEVSVSGVAPFLQQEQVQACLGGAGAPSGTSGQGRHKKRARVVNNMNANENQNSQEKRSIEFALAMMDFANYKFGQWSTVVEEQLSAVNGANRRHLRSCGDSGVDALIHVQLCKWFIYPSFIRTFLCHSPSWSTWRLQVERSARKKASKLMDGVVGGGEAGPSRRELYFEGLCKTDSDNMMALYMQDSDGRSAGDVATSITATGGAGLGAAGLGGDRMEHERSMVDDESGVALPSPPLLAAEKDPKMMSIVAMEERTYMLCDFPWDDSEPLTGDNEWFDAVDVSTNTTQSGAGTSNESNKKIIGGEKEGESNVIAGSSKSKTKPVKRELEGAGGGSSSSTPREGKKRKVVVEKVVPPVKQLDPMDGVSPLNLYWIHRSCLPCMFYDEVTESFANSFRVLPICCTTYHYDVKVNRKLVEPLTTAHLAKCIDDRTKDFTIAMIKYAQTRHLYDTTIVPSSSSSVGAGAYSAANVTVSDTPAVAAAPENVVTSKPVIDLFEWDDFIMDLISKPPVWSSWRKGVERAGTSGTRSDKYYDGLVKGFKEALLTNREEDEDPDGDDTGEGNG